MNATDVPPTARPPSTVFVSAGELSGERIAVAVLAALCERGVGLDPFGLGGGLLAAAGVELVHTDDRLAVTGFSDGARVLGRALNAYRAARREIMRRRPALGVLVDFPGINMRLAPVLKAVGAKVLQVGAPQHWAWLPGRVHMLPGRVDRLAVLLPFEAAWFRSFGVAAHYVGHPSRVLFQPLRRARARAQLGVAPAQPVVAVLPGSRRAEIARHLPVMLAGCRAAAIELSTVVGCGSPAMHEDVARLAPDVRRASPEEVLGAADVAVTASGTAALEAALASVPSVICYRMSGLSHALALRLLRLPSVALPNILLGRPVLPELLQDAMTPSRIGQELSRLLRPEVHRRMVSELSRLTECLGDRDAPRSIARLAEELLP